MLYVTSVRGEMHLVGNWHKVTNSQNNQQISRISFVYYHGSHTGTRVLTVAVHEISTSKLIAISAIVSNDSTKLFPIATKTRRTYCSWPAMQMGCGGGRRFNELIKSLVYSCGLKIYFISRTCTYVYPNKLFNLAWSIPFWIRSQFIQHTISYK